MSDTMTMPGTAAREFALADVMSVLLEIRMPGSEGLRDLVRHVTGEHVPDMGTYRLVQASHGVARPALAGQFPALARVAPPVLARVPVRWVRVWAYRRWLRGLVGVHGSTVVVSGVARP